MEYNTLSKPYLDSFRACENRMSMFLYFFFFLFGILLMFVFDKATQMNISDIQLVKDMVKNSVPIKISTIIIPFICIIGAIKDLITCWKLMKNMNKMRNEFLEERGL